jgi:hypothetical protein
VPRPLLLALAFLAVVAVGWLLVSGGNGHSGRSARDRAADLPEERPPAPPAEDGGGRGPRKPTEGAPKSFALEGQVTEEGGRPVAGAVVRATFGAAVEARTDEKGWYRLVLASPAGTFDVLATAYLPVVDLRFALEGEGPWRRDFALRPAAALTGHVTDENGQPVAGARVYLIPAEHALLDRPTLANLVMSDARGAYEFPGVPAGITDLGVRAAGFLPLVVRDVLVPARGTIRQDVRLARGREVVVTVVGGPQDDFEVHGDGFVASLTRVSAADSRLRGELLPPGGVDALADALVGRQFADLPVVATSQMEPTYEGPHRYRLCGACRGPADVSARVVRAASAEADVYIAEPGLAEKLDTTETEVTLVLVPALRVAVNVRDAVTGNPLEPNVVRRTAGVDRDLPVDLWAIGWWLPRDDRRHALVFTLDGYQDARLDLPDLRAFAPDAPEPPSFDVAMQPTATGESGSFYVVFEPPLDGRVALVGRDASGAQRFVKHIEDADREGRWAVEDVPAGEYSVSVLATGMVPAMLPRVVVARGLKDTYRVTLTAGGGLALRVTDAEGQLLDKVHLLLKDAGGSQIDVHVLSHVSEGRAFLSVNYLPSAASARADSGLAPGFYELAVYREGFGPGRESFEIRGTAVAEVEIALAKATK